MTFASPMMLLLLALPVLMLWSIPLRRAGLTLPFDHQAHPRRRVLTALLTAFECFPALLLAIAVLILAGPQSMQQPKDARELTNIQICMDVSGSMGMENRYELASNAVREFVAAREGDAFGLTIFGSHQIRWTPLTRDLDAIRNALPFANPAQQPMHMSGTMIGSALRFCRENMDDEAQEGDRMIILVSDGASSDLSGGAADDIAEELTEAHITVYHIHVAMDEIPQEVVEIAKATGGEAFQASDTSTLRSVFRHIDRMRPARFRTLGTVPLDEFRVFAAIGLGALALHLVGLLGIRYTPW